MIDAGSASTIAPLEALAWRIHSKIPLVTPVASAIPSMLLIDEDLSFVLGFSSLLWLYRAPLRSFNSLGAMEADHSWNYQMVLLDQDTIGKENILETANRLARMPGKVSIVLVGHEHPTKEEMREWYPFIERFLLKSTGAENIFNEVLKIYATARKRAKSGEFQSYMG